MHESLYSTLWIDERQQELRRLAEDGRERYEEMLRVAAQERELDHAPPVRREPSVIGSTIARRLAQIVSIEAHHRSPTSVGPRARSGTA